jgi:hypothetical protein
MRATDKSVPIVFLHKGYKDYLYYTMRQARLYNPDAPIYLFGDQANNRFSFLTHVDVTPYEKAAYPFEKDYKHYSWQPYGFEMYCLKRYFVLREIMRQFPFDRFYLCDTDLMFYSNVQEEYDRLGMESCDAALYVHPNEQMEEVLIHNSLWTRGVLEHFCDFIRDVYSPSKVHLLEENYRYRQATGHPAAFISDMYILSLFYREYQDQYRILDLSPIRDGATYDYNIGEWPGLNREHTYELTDKEFYGVKKLEIRDGKVYCYHKKLDRVIQFKNLHFAGYNKMLVHRYYQGKPNPCLYMKREWPLLQWYLRKNLRIRTRLNQLLAPRQPVRA